MTHWQVEEMDAGLYRVRNFENGKATAVSIRTADEKFNAFGCLKTAGFNKTERALIFGEIERRENERNKPEAPRKTEEAIMAFTDYFDMADRFIAIQPIFYTRQKLWWAWNFERFCWERVDEVDLLNEMSKKAGGLSLFKNSIKNDVMNALRMRGRLHEPKEAPKHWIQFENRIVDLKTNVVFDAKPEYFVTNPIPHVLGTSKETPVIDALFHDWVEEKYVKSLYQIISYCMLPNYPLHRVFCLNGEGRNGKGTFLSILTKFLGEKNLCSTDFDTLVNRPFEAAKLYKKLVCQMGEINSSIFKRTSLFKKLCGSDMIGFEHKGKDGFDDYNYAKLLIATNKLPESTDKTIGFFSRWMIIDFPNRFKENPNLLDSVPEEEYCNLASRCFFELRELLESGEFANQGEIEERAKRYEERASPIREFLRDCCEDDAFASTPFYKLFYAYEAFLGERGLRKASKNELSRLLHSKGYCSRRVNYEKDDGTPSTMKVVDRIKLEEDD